MITKDKIYHFAVSAILLVIFALLLDVEWSLLIVLALGILKELFDRYYKKKRFDWKDLFADAVGAVAGLWIATLIF